MDGKIKKNSFSSKEVVIPPPPKTSSDGGGEVAMVQVQGHEHAAVEDPAHHNGIDADLK